MKRILAYAFVAASGAVLLQAATVPGSWKVVPGITANQSPFVVGQDIAVVSANDIWQVGFAITGTGTARCGPLSHRPATTSP